MAQLASNTSSSLGNCDRFECVLLCIIVFNVPLLRDLASYRLVPACVNFGACLIYPTEPGIAEIGWTLIVATVLSSAENTTTDSMRACMKIHKTQFLL